MTTTPIPETLAALADGLASGRHTSRELAEACLARIGAAEGEGARTFPHGVSASVLADADAQDRLRREGRASSPFAGIPISVKDNVDLEGVTTKVGSHLFDDDPPAKADAPAVARLRAAGFVVLGHTAMTELAFSAMGVNPHYGTPENPRSDGAARVPGGSSAGAAASVGSGMASAGLGTDTGGSCRIPAAFCGLVGFKPTSARIPRAGVYPLSTTLDCVGSIGHSARCCATLDAFMAGEVEAGVADRTPAGLTLCVLDGPVAEGLTPTVAAAYGAALERLRAAGVRLVRQTADGLAAVGRINVLGGFSSAEIYARLRDRLDADAHRIDPRVLRRVMLGAEQAPGDYAGFTDARARLLNEAADALDRFDAVVMPTTPLEAPRFDDLETDEAYFRLNGLSLRNAAIANMLNRPAISLPCQPEGALPVGLTLMGRTGEDRALLAIASALEQMVRGT
jgi:aspartyl-tRNA(Asn)/glutamyl-tRNA(Gln) amidotransferase subunit A